MIYVSSSCICNDNISAAIRHLADNGIKNIELSGGTRYYGGIEKDLKMLKAQYGLEYACHAYFPPPKIPFVVNLASCNDEIYRKSTGHYDRCIGMLGRIGCGVLSVHAGFLIEVGSGEIGKRISTSVIYDENEAYDRFCRAYERLSMKCRENGIRLYLENNVLGRENYEGFGRRNYFMMTDCESIMRMKEQIGFDLLLDMGHLHVSSNTLGLDYGCECGRLKELAGWFHISGNNGIADEHRPLEKESAILKEFYKIYRPGIGVTLETAGGMQDILSSMELVKGAGTDGLHKTGMQ